MTATTLTVPADGELLLVLSLVAFFILAAGFSLGVAAARWAGLTGCPDLHSLRRHQHARSRVARATRLPVDLPDRLREAGFTQEEINLLTRPRSAT